MYSEGVVALVKEVLTSWQVIVVCVVLLIYLNIVFYMAKSYHRPRAMKVKKPKKVKEQPAAAAGPEVHEDGADEGPSSNDELGLEES
jgi:flagellar biosynthesis/type III secretory pathway M-ring protein FliF/YscJ